MTSIHLCKTLLVLGFALTTAGLALGADRTPADVLKELETAKLPEVDREKVRDRTYVEQYIKQRQEVQAKRSALIEELYKLDPENEKVPTLMAERWANMPPLGPEGDKLMQDVENVLAHTKNEKLRTEAAFVKAQTQLFKSQEAGQPDLAAIDSFIQVAPKDPRGARLLYFATTMLRDPAQKAAVEDRLVKEFPDSQFTGMIAGSRRQQEGLGKPFKLEFADATTGTAVSMDNLKGKVVVIDFWATWCGPCVAEMPEMKKLYEKYHPQGVEFLGISLDNNKEEGGLDELKNYVKKESVPWPQYYQGNGWESEFSRGWGINSIPTMFLVDQEGNLASVEARGKLEELLPQYLAKNAKPQ